MSSTAYFPLSKCNDTLVEVEYFYDYEKGDNDTPPSTKVEIYNIWCALDILEIMENYSISQLIEELSNKIIEYEYNKD